MAKQQMPIKENSFRKKQWLPWILFLTLFAYSVLTLGNLQTDHLWGDEAYRAMIAKNLLLTGKPTHWDGTRYVGGVTEKNLSYLFPGQYIEALSSMFQYYVIAAFYAVFGVSTWVSRFPFWLSGLFILILFYRYRHVFSRSRIFFPLISILLLSNVTFLIYARQANYYMLANLLTLLSSLIFWKIYVSTKYAHYAHFFLLFLINQLLLHTHIPTYGAIFLVQCGFFIAKLFRPGSSGKSFRITLVSYILLSLPLSFLGYLWYQGKDSVQFGQQFLAALLIYAIDINYYVLSLPGIILAIILAYYFRHKLSSKQLLLYMFSSSLLEIGLMAFINYGGGISFRYIASFLVIWIAGLSMVILSIKRVWAVILTLLIILPNLFSGISAIPLFFFGPGVMNYIHLHQPTIPLIADAKLTCFYCDYLDELVHPYQHPFTSIINRLQDMHVKNKKIAMGPCENNTVMFNTDVSAINEIPPGLYKKVFHKDYDLYDADIIVYQSFCPLNETPDQILKHGYSYSQIPYPNPAFIHSEELNTRGAFSFPSNVQAIIFTKNR